MSWVFENRQPHPVSFFILRVNLYSWIANQNQKQKNQIDGNYDWIVSYAWQELTKSTKIVILKRSWSSDLWISVSALHVSMLLSIPWLQWDVCLMRMMKHIPLINIMIIQIWNVKSIFYFLQILFSRRVLP